MSDNHFADRNLYGSSSSICLRLSDLAYEGYCGSDYRVYRQPWNGLYTISLDRQTNCNDLSEDDVNEFFENLVLPF